MIKTIHCIKIGMVEGFGNHELSCITSWRNTYPDFEIKFWGDKEVIDLIRDCKYVCDCYNSGNYTIPLNYAKLKILYEYGGLYMDTDVFSVNRIPDSYFEKEAFIPWNNCLGTFMTNSETALYSKPDNPLFLEFLDSYRNFSLMDKSIHHSFFIDVVLLSKGLEIKNRLRCSLNDIELEHITIVNRVQFGVFDIISGYNELDGRTPYLMNCSFNFPTEPETRNTSIIYQILDDEVDLDRFSDDLNEFINLGVNESPDEPKFVCILFVNTSRGLEREFAERLLYEVPHNAYRNKEWRIVPLGCNLSKELAQDCAIDYISKKFNNVKITNRVGD